jgi:hypothetical protein
LTGSARIPARAAALALALLLTRDADAQIGAGAVTGTIVDSSGSALPGATITAVAETTKAVRSTVTQGDGSYLGQRQTIVALVRRVPLHAGRAVELRMEMFNATNTPPLGAPNGVLGSAAFGSIATAGDPRVVQLAVKVLF